MRIAQSVRLSIHAINNSTTAGSIFTKLDSVEFLKICLYFRMYLKSRIKGTDTVHEKNMARFCSCCQRLSLNQNFYFLLCEKYFEETCYRKIAHILDTASFPIRFIFSRKLEENARARFTILCSIIVRFLTW
jgi:hypothetical protein